MEFNLNLFCLYAYNVQKHVPLSVCEQGNEIDKLALQVWSELTVHKLICIIFPMMMICYQLKDGFLPHYEEKNIEGSVIVSSTSLYCL